MKECAQSSEAVRAVRDGRRPQASAAELREHIAQCAQCSEAVRVQTMFAASRQSATQMAPLQNPELLWWKAQLRRRHLVVTQIKRPAVTIIASTVGASAVLLIAVLVAALRLVNLRSIFAVASSAWSAWTISSVVLLLAGFAVIAVMAAAGALEERVQANDDC